jgi:hypothetical protein
MTLALPFFTYQNPPFKYNPNQSIIDRTNEYKKEGIASNVTLEI